MDPTGSSTTRQDDPEPEQEAIRRRRLELKRTQQDLGRLVARLHEFVNRNRSGDAATDGDGSGDVTGEDDGGLDWDVLTAYVKKHVTELQEIRSLSAFTGVLMDRIKRIINEPYPTGAAGNEAEADNEGQK